LSRGKSFLRGDAFSGAAARLHPTNNTGGGVTKKPQQQLPSLQTSCSSIKEMDKNNKGFAPEVLNQDLMEGLKSYSLEATHGILHAAGMRKFSDLKFITHYDLLCLQFSHEHFIILTQVIRELNSTKGRRGSAAEEDVACAINKSEVSRSGMGVFENPYRRVDFAMTSLCKKNQIYKGRFMNVEQCQHVSHTMIVLFLFIIYIPEPIKYYYSLL
jgi:hypothetical protein